MRHSSFCLHALNTCSNGTKLPKLCHTSCTGIHMICALLIFCGFRCIHISEEYHSGWTFKYVLKIDHQINNVKNSKLLKTRCKQWAWMMGSIRFRALVRSFLHRTESGHAIVSSALLTRNTLQCCNIDLGGNFFVNIGWILVNSVKIYLKVFTPNILKNFTWNITIHSWLMRSRPDSGHQKQLERAEWSSGPKHLKCGP